MQARRQNGNLPKALVLKFGEPTIRRICGLGELSEGVVRRRKERECQN